MPFKRKNVPEEFFNIFNDVKNCRFPQFSTSRWQHEVYELRLRASTAKKG